MTISLNNLDSPQNLLTFTNIPNILKVSDSSGGTYATMLFGFDSSWQSITEYDGQWYITFMGETISNVINPSNAVNKNFYISNSATSTAASICRALRNCPIIAANFNIVSNTSTVSMTAKSIGQIWSTMQNYLDYNMPQEIMHVEATDGSADSSLYNAKIDVDIYSNSNYITTLEKNYYGKEVAFDLSPVLTTIAEYGTAVPYEMKVSSIVDGEYSLLGNVSTNYVGIGYMVNQGAKYMNIGSNSVIAQNFSRGTEMGGIENSTLLYVYNPSIPISIYFNSILGASIKIEYLDSALNVIHTYNTTWRAPYGKNMEDFNFDLDMRYFPLSFYIDVTIGYDKVRYNVIKPLNATNKCQRIYWRNSYGGVSFYDWTGDKTETRDLDVTTYQKNIFGYYNDSINELDKIYDNSVKYNVTLKSHLFEEDGKYIFNDLMQSKNIWTEVNGEQYAIIIDSISVDKVDNNNIYQSTIKYHFSQSPSEL